MSKKLYRIVDPETGKTVGEEYIGGLKKIFYQAIAAGAPGKLRWAARILLALCVLLVLAQPLLEAVFPSFYHRTHEILFIGVIVAFGRCISAVATRSNRKRRSETRAGSEDERALQVVDAESGAIVDQCCPADGKPRFNTSTPRGRLARAMFFIALSCLFLSVLSAFSIFLVPDGWKVYVSMAFMFFFAVMYVSMIVFNHIG